MSLNQTSIITKVRNRTGLTPDDVPDDLILDCSLSALDELSINAPKKVFGFLPTAANVQDYDLPDGTNYQNFTLPWNNQTYSSPKVKSIKDVLFSSGVTSTYPFFDKDFPITVVQDLFNVQFGGNVFESPSLARVLFQKLKGFTRTFGAGFEVIENTLRLFPTPTSDGIACYLGTAAWEKDSNGKILIDDGDNEPYLKAVLWKVAECRAMALAVVESISEAGGNSMRPAHKFWNDKAAEWQNAFLCDIGAVGMPIGIG